jgi:hypothetical protein
MDLYDEPQNSLETIEELALQAANLNEEAFLENISVSMFASKEVIKRATDTAVAVGKHNLLTFAVAEVREQLVAQDHLLHEAALEFVAATLLADDLPLSDTAALSLPWSLGYVALEPETTEEYDEHFTE